EQSYAAASRFSYHRAVARNGYHPRPADEKKRDQGDAFRPDRQEGLPHPPICFLLLLHRVCRRVRFAHGESAAILLLRGPLLGRRIPLRSGVVAVPAQPGISSGEVFALASTQTTPTNSLQQASLRFLAIPSM